MGFCLFKTFNELLCGLRIHNNCWDIKMEAFWGVIVGAIISFLGVLLTLRWNQRVHEGNLSEERRKTREEREFSAKQAVLLAASDAVTRFITYYLSLADRTLPSDGIVAEEVAEIGVAMNRLHFYCSIETIEKAAHLGQVLSKAFTESIIAKMPSAFINEDLKAIDTQILGLEKMNANFQEEIKSILQCDPHNPLIISHRNQLAQNFKTIADLHGNRVELIKQKYIETEKCRDVIKQNLKTIYDALRDVLLFARQELSFSIDQERYKALITEQTESTIRNLEECLAEIRKQVLSKMQ
jgi:hypothetical protein